MPAVDQVDRLADAVVDFYALPRPATAGATDLGASERGVALIFADDFESGGVDAWTATFP
ncbi:MAG: hypothetical protein AAGM22_05420 [Acidobacteriota bacterium]